MIIEIIFPNNLLRKHIEIYYLVSNLSIKYKFKDEIVDDLYLAVIGKKLWKLIKKYNSIPIINKNEIIHFILKSKEQDIQKIPWEIAFSDDFGFIGLNKNFSFSRTFMNILNKNNIYNKLTYINILHISYNNIDLSIAKEKEYLTNTLLEKNKINFINIQDLKKSLVDYTPNILIISGHILYNYEPHIGFSVKPTHNLIEKNSEISLIEIINLIKGYHKKIELVILLGCESTKNITLDIQDNSAYNFLNNNISYVIGMREPILDISSIEFIKSLFSFLGNGKTINESVQLSRKKIILPMKNIYTDIRQNLSYGQWAIPELYFK